MINKVWAVFKKDGECVSLVGEKVYMHKFMAEYDCKFHEEFDSKCLEGTYYVDSLDVDIET